MIVMHLDRQLSLNTRDKTLVKNRISLSFVLILNFSLKPTLIMTHAKTGF